MTATMLLAMDVVQLVLLNKAGRVFPDHLYATLPAEISIFLAQKLAMMETPFQEMDVLHFA